jgi:hypothetical protein
LSTAAEQRSSLLDELRFDQKLATINLAIDFMVA